MTTTLSNDLADDLCRGAEAIAAFEGETVRRVRYMLEKGDLPAFKQRGCWYMRKSKRLEQIAKLEAGEAA